MAKTTMYVKELPIKEIKIGNRRRKDMGDISDLADSIEAVGLLHPVVVDGQFNLLAGSRRIAAHKKLKRPAVPALVCYTIESAEAAMRAEVDENTCRKDFTPEEAVILRQDIEAGRIIGKLPIIQNVEKPDEKPPKKRGRPSRGASAAASATEAITGMSRRNTDKAEKVVEAAKADPSLRPVVDRMNETGNVAAAEREIAEIMQGETPEQEELTPLSKAIAAVNELATLVRQARNLAKKIFQFDENKKATAPFLGRFGWIGSVEHLSDYLRMLNDYTPTGGTANKPVVKLDEQMEKARVKK